MIQSNGKLNNTKPVQPSIHDMKKHFQELYTIEGASEAERIKELSSDMYIPILDDPITERDINEAFKDCKKGGYDYNVPVLGILMRSMLPMLILLFNCLFYLAYPFKHVHC